MVNLVVTSWLLRGYVVVASSLIWWLRHGYFLATSWLIWWLRHGYFLATSWLLRGSDYSKLANFAGHKLLVQRRHWRPAAMAAQSSSTSQITAERSSAIASKT